MEMKKTLCATALILAVLALTIMLYVPSGSAAEWTVDDDGEADFTTIQAAIDNSTDGDTIRVFDGIYRENVLVNRTLTIIGNGTGVTTVDGNGTGDVIKVTADLVNITGFTVTGGSRTGSGSGIEIRSRNNSITNCIFTNSNYGIFLTDSSFNEIKNNSCSGNSIGIRIISESDHNLIKNNTCMNNDRGMLLLKPSSHNELVKNYLYDNAQGMILWGSNYNDLSLNIIDDAGIDILPLNDADAAFPFWLYQTIATSNMVNGRPVYYYRNATDIKVPAGAGEVILVNCSGMVIEGQSFVNGSIGVIIGYSKDNSILNTTFTGNSRYGIRITGSDNTMILNGTFTRNRIGITIDLSSRNNSVSETRFLLNQDYGIDAQDNDGWSINASGNWWGHISGPYHHENNTMGIGDEVSDDVSFKDWIDHPPFDDYDDPTASIGSIEPDYAMEGENITFTGDGEAYERTEKYIWSSSLDGEFYNGTEKTITPFSIKEGFETKNYIDVTGGNDRWSVSGDETYEGDYAAVCGDLTDKEESWMEMTFIGPGTLEFYWKVSSEDRYDILALYVDQKEDRQISGDVDWTKESIMLTDGKHVIRWSYEKDNTKTEGEDKGYLDSINFISSHLLSNGTHTITFRTMDVFGVPSANDTASITINGIPRASISSIAPHPALDIETVTFTADASDDGSIERYVWTSSMDGEFYNGTEDEFGFGSLSNGTHIITLRVQDNNGTWSDTSTSHLTINGKPVCMIDSISPDPALDVENVTFTGKATDDGTIVRYVWKSSIDGEFYNDSASGFEFGNLSNGTHTITFRVQDNNGTWSDDVDGTLVINGKPVSWIEVIDPSPALDVNTVKFKAVAYDDDSIDRYVWTSDVDGEFYNDTGAVANYHGLSNGTHLITMRVQDTDGIWSDTDTQWLTINGRPVGWIESISPDFVLDTENVSFECDGSDDGTVDRYLWTSDLDGEIYNGTGKNFTRNDLSNGTHRITLTVQDNNGSWSAPVISYVTINGKPRAWIVLMDPNPGLDDIIIDFSGNTTDDGSIERYVWSSSIDGEFYNATKRYFSYGNLSNGTHIITLRAQDNNGTWSDPYTDHLTINGRPVARIVSISPDPALDVHIVEFQGNGTDDGTVERFKWTSSLDGILYDGFNASFMFSDLSNGSHIITLEVMDNNNTWSEEITGSIDVNGKPVATIVSISPNPALDIEDIGFLGSAHDDGTIEQYAWSSSIDGEFYNDTDPGFDYGGLSNGTHIISFSVLDDNGTWSDPTIMNISVNGKPVGRIHSILPNPALDVDVIMFQGNGTDDGTIERYVWTSDLDREFYNGTNATFNYGSLSNGSHLITFRVLDDNGTWSDNVTTTLTVNGKPVCRIVSVSPDPSLDVDTLTFTGNGTDEGTIERYVWHSDLDGEFHNDTSEQFAFTASTMLRNGTHTITLLVQDDSGTWSDPVNTTLVINGKPRAAIDSISPAAALHIETVTFQGIGSDDVSISGYEWSSSLDGFIYNGTNASFDYLGLSNGTHIIMLRVQDNEGVWSESATEELIVNGKPSVDLVQVSPSPALDVDNVTFTPTVTEDEMIVEYLWISDLDGTFYSGTDDVITMGNLSNGTHTITLKVRDDQGIWSEEVDLQLEINGQPVAEIVSISPNPVLLEHMIRFEGAGSDEGDVIRYAWYSSIKGEFYNNTGSVFQSDRLQEGDHVIQLRVQDDKGTWSEPQEMILRVIREPIAEIVSIEPDHALHGIPITLVGDGIANGTIERYVWESSLDGILYNGTDDTIQLNGFSNGTHTITLKVLDSNDLWSIRATKYLEINGMPTSEIHSITPNPAGDTDSIHFRALANDDGFILRYVWNSSINGEFYNDTSPEFFFSGLSKGAHTISLQVQDNKDQWSVADIELLHIFTEPIANITMISPVPVLVLENISFRGNVTNGVSIERYVWRSSIDGEFRNTSSASFSYSGLSNGTHTIYLKVKSEFGVWSDEVSQVIRVYRKPLAFIHEIDPELAVKDITVQFTAVTDAEDAVVRYVWQSSIDGVLYDGPNPSFSRSNLSVGVHVIHLSVLTVNGFWSADTQDDLEVYIPNKEPVVEFTDPDVEEPVKGIFVINGSAVDDDGTIVSVEISIDNGSWIEVQGTDSWEYSWDTEEVDNGDHEIRVRSFDGEDYSRISTISLAVENKDDEKDDDPNTVCMIGLLIIILVVLISIYLIQSGRGPGSKPEDKKDAPEKEEKAASTGISVTGSWNDDKGASAPGEGSGQGAGGDSGKHASGSDDGSAKETPQDVSSEKSQDGGSEKSQDKSLDGSKEGDEDTSRQERAEPEKEGTTGSDDEGTAEPDDKGSNGSGKKETANEESGGGISSWVNSWEFDKK